jgi:hypothetical protein
VSVHCSSSRNAWLVFAAVFILVLFAQIALVAVAGTDIPFHDQWDVEGRWLYPSVRAGTLGVTDFLRPHNEHRITWTHLLNFVLFTANGQWDPLVQLLVVAVLRASCAAGLAWQVAKYLPWFSRAAVGAVATIAFMPHLAWHGVLWGFESQIYFSIGFALFTLALLSTEHLSVRRALLGVAAGVAALVAMGPSALAPIALLGLAGLRMVERPHVDRSLVCLVGSAVGLLVLAAMLRVEVQAHAELRAQGFKRFFEVAARVLAWPHVNSPFAALAMNLPLLIVAFGRVLRRRVSRRGEDFVLLVGGWSAAIGLATAWARGGSWELSRNVPSRYVDFVVLLPLANCWAAMVLAQEVTTRWKTSARLLASAWGVFLFVGWLGLSASVMRGIVLPRARDREAPVRLIRAFQMTGDASIFEHQPRLLVPHPNSDVVRAVLNDPRLEGALPPSLQPEKPQGPLSRAARDLFGHQ